MRLRVFIWVWLVFAMNLELSAQVLQDYSDQFKKLGSDSWISSEDKFELRLDLNSFPRSSVHFQISGPSILFANENVWFLASKDSSFSMPLAELKETFLTDTLSLLLIGDQLRSEELVVQKRLGATNFEVSESEEEVLPRKGALQSTVNNVFFLGLLLVMLLVSLYRLGYPFLFATMSQPLSLINAEDFSQSGSLQKFFSADILLYLLTLNLALGLVASTGLVLFREMWVSEWVGFGFWNLFGFWFLISLGLFLLTILKFLLIRITAYLFDLGKIAFSHFFYLLRLLIIGAGIALLVIAFYLVNDFLAAADAFAVLLNGIFWMYLIGVSILFLIMTNRFSFKKYHLFTYLCIAEMVPFLILAKMIMNLGQ
ncbi:DUF4271 domain-containing protein [Algoriphagus namhaensis]